MESAVELRLVTVGLVAETRILGFLYSSLWEVFAGTRSTEVENNIVRG